MSALLSRNLLDSEARITWSKGEKTLKARANHTAQCAHCAQATPAVSRVVIYLPWLSQGRRLARPVQTHSRSLLRPSDFMVVVQRVEEPNESLFETRAQIGRLFIIICEYRTQLSAVHGTSRSRSIGSPSTAKTFTT